MIALTNTPLKPPSGQTISSFEAYCRAKLPLDFLEFLSYGNGGKPLKNIFSHAKNECLIERFLPLTDDPESDAISGQYDIAVVETQIGERLATSSDQLGCALIPFAALFGGDFLCFDYRVNKASPAVVVWDHNQSDEFSPHTTFVAISFTKLLTMISHS